MELAIPLVALGGLYIVSKSSKKTPEKSIHSYENFDNIELPNTNIPNKNFPTEYPVQSVENDQSSRLSTVNKYDSPNAYTDKYFNPASNVEKINSYSPMGSKQEQSALFTSMTGQKVDSSYFSHNNQVPFFGGQVRYRSADANSNESTLDNYVGSGSQIFTKTEQSPLFRPGENYNYAFGTPNMNDFYQSRVNPSLRMANVKPFEEQRVAPGLGLGYTNDGGGGYNSGMASRESWLPKTVDELRVENNKKSSEHAMLGHEGPGNSFIKNRGMMGQMEKNRVETSFELGADRLFTTTGIETAPTARAIPIERFVNRPETTVSYTGVARGANDATYNSGEYMESKHMDLGPVPYGVASATGKKGANMADYGGKQSKTAYPNNRSVQQDAYFGAFSGAIGAVVAPLLDALRPSRKENVMGNLRPYENAHTRVSSSYIFNPADRPAPTIRETTEKSSYIPGVNTHQNGGGYQTAEYQPVRNERDTTNQYYGGNASAGDRSRSVRPYDAEYNQRNNDIKSSTIQGHMVPGNMNLLNSDINMRNRTADAYLKNSRPLVQTTAPQEIVSLNSFGKTSEKNGLYSTIQMDRNTPDILDAFKKNPYTHSLTNIP
jgi:hypothetical protein